MLTPQEVAEHAFAKASFGGYNMAMVDEFLDLLTADYTTLYKENATLKAKMKVLADKIEEYRSTEDAMRKALLSAQKMADQLVAEAEDQKAAIMEQAETEARAKLADVRREVESEKLRLAAAQNATAGYVAKLKGLYEHEMSYLATLSKISAEPPRPDPVAQAADAIGDAVEKAVEEELPPAPAPAPAPPAEEKVVPLEADSLYQELRRGVIHQESDPTPEQPPEDGEEEDQDPTRRIDFGKLKFGKDYEIE